MCDCIGGVGLLHSYGTIMLFAAGVGISHQVSQVRDLVARYQEGTAAVRKVVLIWIIQSPGMLPFFFPNIIPFFKHNHSPPESFYAIMSRANRCSLCAYRAP